MALLNDCHSIADDGVRWMSSSENCKVQSDVIEVDPAEICTVVGFPPDQSRLTGDELRALRVLKREANSPFIFVSERGTPFSIRLGQADRARGRRGQHVIPGAFARTAARLRLRAGQQGRGHSHLAVLAGPPLDPVHSALH